MPGGGQQFGSRVGIRIAAGLHVLNKTTTTKPPLYFGWYPLGAVFFIDLVVTGSCSSFGIFVLPMSEEFGWSRFTISLAAALGAIVGGVTQPFLGYIFDRA
jgi:hypothetical protein